MTRFGKNGEVIVCATGTRRCSAEILNLKVCAACILSIVWNMLFAVVAQSAIVVTSVPYLGYDLGSLGTSFSVLVVTERTADKSLPNTQWPKGL